jgi:hypothetical protein
MAGSKVYMADPKVHVFDLSLASWLGLRFTLLSLKFMCLTLGWTWFETCTITFV